MEDAANDKRFKQSHQNQREIQQAIIDKKEHKNKIKQELSQIEQHQMCNDVLVKMQKNHSNHAFESRREIRDRNQASFFQLHMSNPRLDNPLLTLQDKQRLAEEKARREQAEIGDRIDKVLTDEKRRRERSVEDLKAYYKV
jgi:hypothetical protein